MKRFKNILVVNSGQNGLEKSVKVAGALAKRNDALLRLVDVVSPFPSYTRMLGPDYHVDELEQSLSMMRHEALECAAGTLRNQGLDVTTEVLRGTPFVELIQEVQRGDHDLIIKTAGEEGGLSTALFGSTDLHLLRKSPCPVWILKPEGAPSFRRMIAAVEIGADTEEGRGLNRMILELSTSLAAMYGSELHVVHCWEVPGANVIRRRTSPEDYEIFRYRLLKEARSRYYRLLENFSEQIPADRQHLLEGEPELQLVRFAEEKEVDLIVMGTVGRSGVPGLFIGNTAEKVISQVKCGVLTAKPAGFVSPVTIPRQLVSVGGGAT